MAWKSVKSFRRVAFLYASAKTSTENPGHEALKNLLGSGIKL